MDSASDRVESTLREALQELSEFTYSPLPSAGSIRLLEINLEKPDLEEEDKLYSDGHTKDVIVCTLHTVDLNDLENPTSYDALSYTWGNPFSVFRSKEDAAKADILYATKVPIICSGKVLQMGRNLYDALLSLRTARRSKFPLNKLGQVLESKPVVHQLIWIDAICINQEDLLERNSQVQIMDRIYRNAETTHIWLGPEDDFSLPALLVIDALERAPPGSLEKLELSYDLESSQYKELRIKQITPEYWRCLFAFFERRWFRRAWIVQEVVWSKFGLVSVGPTYTCWSKLVSATTSLQASLNISNIWNNAIKIALGLLASPTPMYLATEVISASEVLEINPVTIIHLIRKIRASIGIVDPLIRFSERPKVPSHLEILASFRSSQCQDPRDRVYAFLSLWPHQVLEPKPTVDYSRTVAQVYTDAAWVILKSSGNLGILSHVRKGDAFENLLRVKKAEDNLNLECPYNASGGHAWQVACSSNENPNHLKVQGKKIGSIKTLAKFDRNNLTPLMPVLIDIQPLYGRWKVEVRPIQGGDPNIKNTSAESSTSFQHEANPNISTRCHAAMGTSNPWGVLELICCSYEDTEPQLKIFEHFFETSFEAIWRTLIVDVWKDQHPAPINAGFAFADFLIEESKANTAEECQSVWRTRILTLMQLSSWGDLSVHLYEEIFPHRIPPVRFLPPIKTTADITAYKFINSKNHFQWSRYLSREKAIFSTSTGSLGAACTAAKTGDEIWIVAGSDFPFILRHSQNGRYEFVGEAYVRGIMNGEALRDEGSPGFVDIILQ
ncbi:hypothetical protein G7Y89_g1065 [Cudoniella acicularis]|uniref:Heterokaryon incompatibility domain-containing protein n=1 Tax=Cudoniella acicularis TaxID=354080 RepID=A0A8H4RW08_9HELO|nr:hypothetical protein G7Y89_g1065 [Cudoniella acicularis]